MKPVQVGPYRMTRLLGAGGMGQVHVAEDPRLGRRVAIKILAPEFTGNPGRVARFEREARAASALNHPNIVTIHDIGDSELGRYIVMELVEGKTIRALIGTSPSFETVADIGRQIADALDVAHAAGIVHRDIKPENVMLRHDGYVKVLDFGLVRLISQDVTPPTPAGSEAATLAEPHPADDADPAVSRAGGLVGTAPYMSPEQALGRPVSRASDLFSFGVLLYELATGVHPFASSSLPGVLSSIVSHRPVAPSRINPGIPPPFEQLVLRLLEKDAYLRPGAGDVRTAFSELTARSRPATARGPAVRTHTVGREAHLATLEEAFAEATASRGLLLCVSGEPGIGKTELVEDFLRSLPLAEESVLIARGRCSERLAGTGAYLPFLEALDSLLHVPQATEVARALQTVAPTWYRQLTPAAAAEGSEAAPAAASQELLMREMAAFLGEVSRARPLALFLDDLHWADAASVDLLDYLATRFDSLRVLVVGTYRPTELKLTRHPFQQVKLQLAGRGTCREIQLGFLSREDVESYVALEFPEHRFGDDLAKLIHAKTEGNPLYMVNLLGHLKEQRIIARDRGSWALTQSIPDLERELPESIRSMIQVKIDRLDDEDRRLLMAASVQGHEFESAVVSRALAIDPLEAEERLDRLETVHALVRPLREHDLPDGTLSVRYQFVHVLYQNALQTSLRPARRAALSKAVAGALLELYGDQRDSVASELGILLQSARDFGRAGEFFQVAARRAARLCAHHEAIALARRGLQAIAKLADTPERRKQELDLQTTLGPLLMATQGWSSGDVQAAYDRARELCGSEEVSPAGYSVLRGLWQFYLVRGDLATAAHLAGQTQELAQKLDDPALVPDAHRVVGETAMMTGDFETARRQLELGIARYDPRAARLAEDPGSLCPAMASWALWILGYPDQATTRSDEGWTRAAELEDPFARTLTAYFAAVVDGFCGRFDAALTRASEVVDLSTEHGFGLLRPVGGIVRAWAAARRGAADAELEPMRRSLADSGIPGARLMQPFFHYLTADACAHAGRAAEGLELIATARATMEDTAERWCGAELYRLEGSLLESAGGPGDRVEACYRKAIDIARGQRARSFELRATLALAGMKQDETAGRESLRQLADLYRCFEEGLDTADLRHARSLLRG